MKITFIGAGSKSGNGFTPFRQEGAAYEIHLSAGTGENACADGVSANLTGKIHFGGGIDGGHFAVAGNVVGVVGVSDILHQDVGIVVQERIYFIRAQ